MPVYCSVAIQIYRQLAGANPYGNGARPYLLRYGNTRRNLYMAGVTQHKIGRDEVSAHIGKHCSKSMDLRSRLETESRSVEKEACTYLPQQESPQGTPCAKKVCAGRRAENDDSNTPSSSAEAACCAQGTRTSAARRSTKPRDASPPPDITW